MSRGARIRRFKHRLEIVEAKVPSPNRLELRLPLLNSVQKGIVRKYLICRRDGMDPDDAYGEFSIEERPIFAKAWAILNGDDDPSGD